MQSGEVHGSLVVIYKTLWPLFRILEMFGFQMTNPVDRALGQLIKQG